MNDSLLTEQQQMWVCAQIDHWYYEWKGKICDSTILHRLGGAKEELKRKLCQDKL